MIVGTYTLDLYCDTEGCDQPLAKLGQPDEFIAELGTTCRRQARQAGWTLKRNGTAVCPQCSGKDPQYWEKNGWKASCVGSCRRRR